MQNNIYTDSRNTDLIIEVSQRFSQSRLWQMQRDFYSAQGVDAWRTGLVPHYVTSNPYIASAYARVVFGWLRDVADHIDRTEPVYIVELGTGSGRFSYHFLKAFFEFFEQSVLSDLKITYIMTDFTERNLEFWKNHPQLKPWVASGRLDFALFNGEEDDSLSPVNSGIELTSETMKNPMAVIANYFFDGLTQDIFHFHKGRINEMLVTLTAPNTSGGIDNPEIINDLRLFYDTQPAKPDYYDDPLLNKLLKQYQKTITDCSIMFPIGPLGCVSRLLKLSGGRMFLLTADKGNHLESDIVFYDDPDLVLHGGCFSLMVNYHAMGEYAKLTGGHYLSLPYRHNNIDICACIFGAPPEQYPETRQAYHLSIIQNSPDDYFRMKKNLDKEYDNYDLLHLLSFLRISGWDSVVYMRSYEAIIHHLGEINEELREELHRAIQLVWDMHYHIGEEHDVPFGLGQLLYELQYYDEAVEFFHRSIQWYGPHASTYGNLAMCFYEQGHFEKALGFVNQALELEPDSERAGQLLETIQGEINQQNRYHTG